MAESEETEEVFPKQKPWPEMKSYGEWREEWKLHPKCEAFLIIQSQNEELGDAQVRAFCLKPRNHPSITHATYNIKGKLITFTTPHGWGVEGLKNEYNKRQEKMYGEARNE